MRWLVAVLLLADMLGSRHCGNEPGRPSRPSRPQVLPAWIDNGSGTSEQRFAGVGVAAGIRNARLRRETANDRARSELAKVLLEFGARVSGGPALDLAGQQALAEDSQVTDHFVTNEGTEYALLLVDLSAWKRRAAAALDAGASDLDARADKAFAEAQRAREK